MKRKTIRKIREKGENIGSKDVLDDFNICVDDGVNWDRFMRICGEINDECVLDFREDDMRVSIRDVAQNVGLRGIVPKEFFSKYDVEEGFSVCLNLGLVKELNKGLREGDIIVMRIDEMKGRFSYGIIKNGELKLWKLELIDERTTDCVLSRVPKIKYKGVIKIEVDKLLDIVESARKISKFIEFEESKKGNVMITANNSGVGSFEVEFGKNYVSGDVKGLRMRVNSNYINVILRILARDGRIVLKVMKNVPLYMDIKMGFIKFRYWIAPLVEYDENETKKGKKKRRN